MHSQDTACQTSDKSTELNQSGETRAYFSTILREKGQGFDI